MPTARNKPKPAPRRAPASTGRNNFRDQAAPITLGNRLRRARMKLKMSIRDLAEKSGVNKDTIVKLEKGHTPSYRTLCRICDGLGVTVVQLLRPEADSEFADDPVAIHLRKKEKRIPPQGDRIERARVKGAGARQLLASDDSIRLSWLDCRLPGGKLNSWLLELSKETETTTHAGEEFVFCLRGSAELTVAGTRHELAEGDAATFWSAEPHSYGPSDKAIAAGELPVLLLSVWVSSAEKTSVKK